MDSEAITAALKEDAADQTDVFPQDAAVEDINTIKTGVPLMITPRILQRLPLFSSISLPKHAVL